MTDKRNTGKRKRIDAMAEKFKKGYVLSRDDFKAAGFNDKTTKNALIELKENYELDLITLYRRRSLIGWILANEVL